MEPSPTDAVLDDARAALRQGDAATARRLLSAAPPTGEILELRARAAYLELEIDGAIEQYQHSYDAFHEVRDLASAGRVAATLGYMHGVGRGDWAVAQGWVQRAQTLLGDDPRSSSAGWVELYRGMFEGDRHRKDEHLRRALDIGRSVGDRDLELQSLAYLGASLVHADCLDEGMALLDEALAGAIGSEIDDFLVLNDVFCQLYSACEHAHDVDRADQWIRAARSITERRRLPLTGAFCHTHYGAILTDAGRWTEAETALTDAMRLWALGHRRRRSAAQARLACLRALQGRIEEADALLEELDADDGAARPAALVLLAQGQPARAVEGLERALATVDRTSTAAAALWSLLVEANIEAGDTDAASAAVEAIAQCAAEHHSDYVSALAAFARGRLATTLGDGAAQEHLRGALAGFARVGLPLELARCRLELASLLATDQPDVALADARAALVAFERLDASRHIDAATALLRSLGVRPSTARRRADILTKRESEVLELVGHGLTNPEIAERLYISRKTVEHHLGNVFAKLGLRTRAQAAAYATRSGLDSGGNSGSSPIP